MTAVGCYTLQLYCTFRTGQCPDPPHEYNEFPHEFNHELGSTCRRLARKAGWILRQDGEAICPKCRTRKPGDSDNG